MLKKVITASLLAFSLPVYSDVNSQPIPDYSFLQGIALEQLQFNAVLQNQMLRQQEARMDQLAFQRQE